MWYLRCHARKIINRAVLSCHWARDFERMSMACMLAQYIWRVSKNCDDVVILQLSLVIRAWPFCCRNNAGCFLRLHRQDSRPCNSLEVSTIKRAGKKTCYSVNVAKPRRTIALCLHFASRPRKWNVDVAVYIGKLRHNRTTTFGASELCVKVAHRMNFTGAGPTEPLVGDACNSHAIYRFAPCLTL